MRTAVFWGCCILTNQYAYELSLRETLHSFHVDLLELPESNCCGDPIRSVNGLTATYLASRVLALANATRAHDLLIPCSRCHFMISEARDSIGKNEGMRGRIIKLLEEEGFSYNSDIRIWHTIDFLHDLIGTEKIKNSIKKPLHGIKIASHVGCQTIRYSDLGRVDNAENPRKLDELVNSLGADAVDYPEKLDCCGSALMNSHPDSALSLAGSKLTAIKNLGLDAMVTSCPECQLMFDARQKEAGATLGAGLNLPVLYYTQILGLALGIDQKKLGLDLNQSPVDQLLHKIAN